MIGDIHTFGWDIADPGGDRSVMTVGLRPGRLRRFLRWIGLDRSTWEIKILSEEEI